MNNQSESRSKKKSLSNKKRLIGLGVLGLCIFWVTITVIIPLARGNGVDKYSGLKKQLAQVIVELTHLYNKPKTPIIPSSIYNVSVDDIHPVTQKEITQYCKDPTYITSDQNDPHFYTVMITEQYLLSPFTQKTTYIGCNHTDYIYTQAFGYPKGQDPRTSLPLPN